MDVLVAKGAVMRPNRADGDRSGVNVARLVRLVACGALLAALPGCGTLRATVWTTVHPNLSVSRRIEVTATGMFANLLATSSAQWMQHLPEGQKPQVEASWQGAEYHLSAEVRNVPAAQWRVTFGEDNISRRYCFFFSDYRYRGYREAEHQPDAMRTAGDEMAQAMAAAMFTMQEKVTMPGRIIHSNATHVERGTGTWDIALNQVGSGYELSARSRRMNLPEIVAAVLFLLAGIALVLHRSGLPSIQHWSQAPDEARAVQQPPGCEEGAAPPAEAEGPSDDAERAVARAKRLLHQGMTGDALQLLQAHLEDHHTTGGNGHCWVPSTSSEVIGQQQRRLRGASCSWHQIAPGTGATWALSCGNKGACRRLQAPSRRHSAWIPATGEHRLSYGSCRSLGRIL